MYCKECGSRESNDSKFCSRCGTKISNSQSLRRYDEKSSSLLLFLLPMMCLILMGGASFGYYLYEMNNNKKVSKWKESGEKLASIGKYEEALQDLKRAQSIRPQYTVLKKDMETIQKAQNYQNQIDQVSKLIKTRKFSEAKSKINALKTSLTHEKSLIFQPMPELVAEKETIIKVAEIKEEFANLNTVDELAAKLSIIQSLTSTEAPKVKEQIINKIVQVTSDQTEKDLKKHNFSEAINLVEKALTYSSNNKKLLELKNTIDQSKSQFEKSEQQRIQQAKEAAAREDLKNHTSAVKVVSLENQLDEYGDLNILGEIKNTATKGIYSVNISYSVYDVQGVIIDTGYTTVFPYYLDAGETGTFSDTVYSVYQDAKVQIDNIEWILE
ncbi:FxLYD domain-containing protein [Falsibacillus albus]|uniref:Uncharacterized protein n=1 Tax=Falsibacillus albus TaxID=2478915 RepID=A0A3L7JYW2_9BACI|nr:FxLYD domain-containing protein [Falsibacillus albus]RLQ94901.1 hypothetical protein D9X91_13040 [Falsibacillus albus]